MPIQVLLMLDNQYPFGQSEENQNKSKTIVKQIITLNNHQHSQALRLAKIAKKLTENSILVKLQTVLQEQTTLHLLYQYAPIRLDAWIQTMDKQFLKIYRDQLFQLAEHLAFNGIITNLELRNLGLNQAYQPKYFLGLNFMHKKQFNKYQLKSNYIQQIKLLFSPYLQNSNKLIEIAQPKNAVQKIDKRMSDIQQMQKVQNYFDKKTNNIVKTRKHESIYYQKTKDKQIRQRKQSYMSSVSNVRLNNLYKRINQVELQVSNTKSPQKNHFKICFQNREITSKSSYDNQIKLQKGANSSNRQLTNTSNSNSVFQNVRGIKNTNQLQNTLVSLVNSLRASGNRKVNLERQVKNKKIQMYKQKQYQQMANTDDPIFQDFKSVLEDNCDMLKYSYKKPQIRSLFNEPVQFDHPSSNKKPDILSIQNQPAYYNDSNTNQKSIKSRVQDVIMNSKKLISKFKEKSKKHLSTQH